MGFGALQSLYFGEGSARHRKVQYVSSMIKACKDKWAGATEQ